VPTAQALAIVPVVLVDIFYQMVNAICVPYNALSVAINHLAYIVTKDFI